MPFVSVVVPAYNAEECVERCVLSLLHQSLKDIEIIVINDGSNDQTLAMLKQLEEMDARLKVYTQKNQGISYSRNKGIQLCNSPYLVFIDSDDYVEASMLQSLYEFMESKDLDIAVCDFYECDVKTQQKTFIEIPDFPICSIEEHPELLFSINSSPWNKMYRLSFLQEHKLSFPLKKKYEDAQFLLSALILAKRIGKKQEAFIFYQIHEGSETTSMDARVFDIFDILENIRKRIIEEHKWESLHEYMEYFAINRICVYGLQQVYQKDSKLGFSFIDAGFEYLNSTFPGWRKNIPYKRGNSFGKRIIKSNKWMMKLYVRIRSK